MNAFTRFAAAALIGVGFATAAAAQENGPRITGYGVDTTLTPSENAPVFGGALTRVVGSGESATVEVIEVQHVQPGRVARVIDSGANKDIVYENAAPTLRLAQAGQQG